MATIGDVAKMAGVSKTTISRFLNNQAVGHMAPETSARIQKAIDALQYNPSAVAQSLKKKSTNLVGLVVHDMTNPFLQQMIQGVETELQGTGMNLLLCSSCMDLEKEIACIRMLNQRQVDGILLVGLNYPIEHIAAARSKVPIVLLEREAPHGEYDMLLINNKDGAYRATEHLIQRGHTKIAHVHGAKNAVPAAERFAAYQQCLRDHGLPCNEQWLFQGNYKPESGYQAMDYLLHLEDRPTAVFFSNDGMAIGAIQYVADHGITVPDDVALVGFDDINVAALVTPSLTTVKQPVHQLARAATKILLKRIKMGVTEEFPIQSVTMSTELIIRRSS